jgi:hypothetical protein
MLPGDRRRRPECDLRVARRRAPRAVSWRVPLQNRVTPFGEIIATPERGTMFGNRGVLHDDQRSLVRTSQVRRWICCVLAWKGIRRTLMKPRSYTELFFLDEATAFAAGHRPCWECRRAAALAFQAAWGRAFGVLAKVDAMDRALDAERRERGGGKKTYRADARTLPDGAFVARAGSCQPRHGSAFLVRGGRLHAWTPGGYVGAEDIGAGEMEVLTPPSIVAVFNMGYSPSVHPSAAIEG